MLGDWTPAAALGEALLGTRRSFVPLPELRVVERPGWLQIITPTFRDGSFNGVSLSVLGEDEADQVIDRTIEEYRRLGIKFRWSVPPGSKPDDLGDRLARRGLVHTSVRAMARTTSHVSPLVDPDIRVEEIGARDIEVYTRVMAEGWSTSPEPLLAVHRAVLADPGRCHHLFLALHRGQPAAVASYAAFERSAYLIGAVVLPRYRGLGLYRASVTARLRAAASRGLSLATSQAMETTSAPLLEHMGFDTLARFSVYRG
jgi:GNAT superfamily N-acetyltransferase